MDLENSTIAETTETEADNLEVEETTEPEVTDNSETETEEPEEKEEVETQQEEQQSQFKTLEDATKSYSELQKKLGQNSNELGRLRKIEEAYNKMQAEKQERELQQAQDNGFNTVQEYQTNKALVDYRVNEYSKHLKECDFPDEIQNLLTQYKANPSQELLDTIEAEFPLRTVKEIAVNSREFEGQLQQKENEALTQQITDSARAYLDENVNKYKDEFENPAFAQIYGEAFKAFGCDLDTDKFVGLMKEFANSVIKANENKEGIEKENKSATDEIAGLSIKGTPNNSRGGSLLNLSEDALNRRLDELL